MTKKLVFERHPKWISDKIIICERENDGDKQFVKIDLGMNLNEIYRK